MNRQDEWPLIDFAVYQWMGGNPEASIPLLQQALAINPNSPKANYEMGELLRDLHRYAEARKYLEKALQLQPCNARTVYDLAIVTRQVGDTARSAELFERFKQVDRESKEAGNDGNTCTVAAQRTAVNVRLTA